MERGKAGYVQEFPSGTTLKQLFTSTDDSNKDIVFLRHALDFSGKTPAGKRDEVLEENLLDVK